MDVESQPTVIALKHYRVIEKKEELTQTQERVQEYLNKLAAVKQQRRVFIELNEKVLESIRSGEYPFIEPFSTVVLTADEQNWTVIPLGRKLITDVRSTVVERTSRKFRFEGPNDPFDFQTIRYINQNLRERAWAHKIKMQKPGEHDLIVMHPNHVEGFLKETGHDPQKVVWINKPDKKSGILKRLDGDELAKFLAERKSRLLERRGMKQ